MALRRTFRVTLLSIPLLTAAACVPQNNAPKAASAGTPAVLMAPGAPVTAAPIAVETAAPQARTATYNCAGGGRITIENLGTSLHVLSPDGTAEDLPASPANQNSRYGAAHDAIVIDGREALVMKGGKTPVTCKR
ncbi:hypothetical protein ACWGTI_21520 [Mesorhizobium sp. ArgA1]